MEIAQRLVTSITDLQIKNKHEAARLAKNGTPKFWSFYLHIEARAYSRCGPNYEKRPSLLTSVQFIDAVGVK